MRKRKFLDLIAKEKCDIPSDIYNGVINNKNKWNEVREILNKGDKND
mgnify:FL=1